MRSLLAVGLSLVSVLSSAMLVRAQTPNALNQVGYFAELAGELDLAESMWRQKMSISPDDVSSYLSLGNVLLETENWAEAQAVFEDAVSIAPKLETPYIGLGTALRRQGKFEPAQAAFESAIGLNTRSPFGYSLLGRMQRDRKQFTEATAAFQTILQLEPAGPNAALAYWDLGKTFSAQGNNEDAELAYRRAIGLNRDNLEFWQSLAGVVRNQGRTSEMASIAGEISRIKDSDPLRDAEQPPLKELYGTDRYQAQVAEAQAILQDYPDNVTAYLELGIALPKLGQFVEAEAALQQATRLNPSNPMAHYLLSEALMSIGREEDAQAAYRSVQQLYPEIDESAAPLEPTARLVSSARIKDYIEPPARLLTLSRPEASAIPRPTARALPPSPLPSVLVRPVPSRSSVYSLRWNPDSAVLQGRQGEMLRSQGKLFEAETAFREMARLDPRQAAVAYNNLGVVLYEQDKIAEAEAALTEATRQTSSPDPQAYLNLATVLKKQGRWGDAASLYQEAKRKGLDDALVSRTWNYHLLQALTASARSIVTEGGSPEQAERAYRSAIRIATDDAKPLPYQALSLSDELATLLFSQGQLQEAEALYTEVIAAYPRIAPQVYLGLWQVLNAQGRTEEANALAERSRAATVSLTTRLPSVSRVTRIPILSPPSTYMPASFRPPTLSSSPSANGLPNFLDLSPVAIAQNAYGQKKLAQGRYYHAEYAFNEALRYSPSYPDALVNNGLALLYQDENAKAEDFFRKAIALNPSALKCYILPPQAETQSWQPETYLQTGETCLPLLLN